MFSCCHSAQVEVNSWIYFQAWIGHITIRRTYLRYRSFYQLHSSTALVGIVFEHE